MKLIIPKGDGTLEMAIQSLKIYYEKNDWVSNEEFKTGLINVYPNFSDKNEAFLLHKGRTARYFGLIAYLYKQTGNLKGNQGKITENGKRFYEAYLADNQAAMVDTIMDCVSLYTFGRHNYGVQGNSDVEMPALLLRASLELGFIMRTEFVVLLYLMHDQGEDYEAAIAEIKNQRAVGHIQLPGDLSSDERASIHRRYGDNKAAQLMRELNIFVNDTEKYELTQTVRERYEVYIRSLKPKITVPESSNEEEVETINKIDAQRVIQKIMFGPPGTGKSYEVSQIIKKYYPNYGEHGHVCPYVFRTTVYPEYSYYDFIGNIMPVVAGESITYDFQPGVFTNALCKALRVEKENIPVFLVVEEMSRGNIASIFGDIFQLLDRDDDGNSEYTIDHDLIAKYLYDQGIEEYSAVTENMSAGSAYKKEIYLPANLHIIGTVNTSDQNVFVMDTAFKRRFDFEYMDIDPVIDEETGAYLNMYTFQLGAHQLEWNDFYQKLNEYIVTELEMPEDKQIGQFFIKFAHKSDEENYEQLQNKLLQYLWEDIHLITITDSRLFHPKYTSFSAVYKDFKKRINVFNSEFVNKFATRARSEEESDQVRSIDIDEEV